MMAQKSYDPNIFKRVTVPVHIKHKRFIEDYAHERRITQYQALYELLEKALKK